MKELQFLVIICAMFSCSSFLLIALMYNEFRNSFAKIMSHVVPDFASKVKIEKSVSFYEAVYYLQNGLADYAETHINSYSVMVVIDNVPVIATREEFLSNGADSNPFRNATEERDNRYSYYLRKRA